MGLKNQKMDELYSDVGLTEEERQAKRPISTHRGFIEWYFFYDENGWPYRTEKSPCCTEKAREEDPDASIGYFPCPGK